MQTYAQSFKLEYIVGKLSAVEKYFATWLERDRKSERKEEKV